MILWKTCYVGMFYNKSYFPYCIAIPLFSFKNILLKPCWRCRFIDNSATFLTTFSQAHRRASLPPGVPYRRIARGNLSEPGRGVCVIMMAPISGRGKWTTPDRRKVRANLIQSGRSVCSQRGAPSRRRQNLSVTG